ncbi:Fungal specific transcription factor domain [Ceratobasidium sp. AG-Ba]|nr:Fungal specific transcription factor domain [Ceratobasidium sp. AG-Ba]
MKPPSSTENAGSNVLPRHGACLVCRKRKLKCDATKPECHECLATGRTCHYEDETYRSRTQQLQDRIKELEARIKEAESQGSSISSKPRTSNSSSGGSPSNGSYTNGGSTVAIGSRTGTHSPGNSLSPPVLLSPAHRSASDLSSNGSNRSGVAPYEPTSDQTRRLLEAFVLHQVQCAFELNTDRVIANLRSGATEPVLPVLLNAMLLMGSHFIEDQSLKHLEPVLLERTKREIDENLEKAIRGKQYNSVHHLQAMCMVGLYYYIKGRLLEGHHHCTSAIRFAVSLGLNQISSRTFKPNSPARKFKRLFESDQWRPRDPVELGEAINLWWTCCLLDGGGSAMNGLPPSVSMNDISTVWPCMLVDFEAGLVPNDNYSIAALLDPKLFYDVANASKDNVKGCISKAIILMTCAGQLDIERVANPAVSEQWWKRFESCDRATVRFIETLPPVRTARNVEELAYLVFIHTLAYCATVQLHSALAEFEIVIGAQGDPRGIQPDGTLGGLSWIRCTEACRATTLAARLIADLDMKYMHMFIGLSWVCVAEVLTRDVPRLRQAGQIEKAREKAEQLDIMEQCMSRLVATYPVLDLQVRHLQALKNW